MSLFWTIPLSLIIVVTGTGLCFWVLHKAQEVDSSVWILEHVVCPMLRIVMLLAVVSLVYPVIDEQSTTADFWRVLGQQGQFNDLLNILFIAGLLLAFVPLLGHPVFALPLQSMLTIALVFEWQYAGGGHFVSLLPSLAVFAKIFGYMLFAWFLTREASIRLSRLIDRSFAVDGSIRLVSDAIYLLLQIPVMLIYCGYLQAQLSR
jgi:hypothetical protein